MSSTMSGKSVVMFFINPLWYFETHGPSSPFPSMTVGLPYQWPLFFHPPRVIPSITVSASE
jgi:hypothetical protein